MFDMEPWKYVWSNTSTWHSNLVVKQTTSFVYRVYQYVVVWPLSHLYFFGPAFQGYGFWQGRTATAICAQLTPSAEEFWQKQPLECQRIIDTHFYSLLVPLEIGFYFYAWYVILGYLRRRYL